MLIRMMYKRFPKLKKFFTWVEYELISRIDRNAVVTLMNFGYSYLDGETSQLELTEEEESQRFQIQMYHQLARNLDCSWANFSVLEVSSGRGGGAAFLFRTRQPHRYNGLDLSGSAVEFCRRHYSHLAPGLTFSSGEAGKLPFEDHQFDVVLNVEASLYYPDLPGFFNEVFRVLKPGGHFLYTDLRYYDEIEEWFTKIQAMQGLTLISKREITSNVYKALELDRARKQTIINKNVPSFFRMPFEIFAGTQDGASLAEVNNHPQKGERQYYTFVFKRRV